MSNAVPQGKPCGFKTLSEISGFISIFDGEKNWVMKFTVVANKILKIDKLDAEGRPQFMINSANVLALLTPEEYKAITSVSGNP